MINTVMVENANPRHPFGARGVGEVPMRAADGGGRQRIADAIGIPHARPADVAATAARRIDANELRAPRNSIMPRVVISGQAAAGSPAGRPSSRLRRTISAAGWCSSSTPVPRPRPPDRGEHGGGDRRRNLPGRLPRPAQPRERDLPDPKSAAADRALRLMDHSGTRRRAIVARRRIAFILPAVQRRGYRGSNVSIRSRRAGV